DEQPTFAQRRFALPQATEGIRLVGCHRKRFRGHDPKIKAQCLARRGCHHPLVLAILPAELDHWGRGPSAGMRPKSGNPLCDLLMGWRQLARYSKRSDQSGEPFVRTADAGQKVKDTLVDADGARRQCMTGAELQHTPAPERSRWGDCAPVRIGQRSERETE